jgi:hypothetical protein
LNNTKIAVFVLLSFCFQDVLVAQSHFGKVSRPEKVWVLLHPFNAWVAYQITKVVEKDVDSIYKSGVIGSDNNGGFLDAFKHTYWMASLANKIGVRKSLKLGRAHEKGNFLQFKHHRLEDQLLPDSVSSEMDLRNNSKGVSLILKGKSISQKEIQKIVLEALFKGELTVIKKDEQGRFLTCDGVLISMSIWKGKWNIPKCLVYSFEH